MTKAECGASAPGSPESGARESCLTPAPSRAGRPKAGNAGQWECLIRENRKIATRTWLLRLEAPELARRILPGQFVMVRMNRASDPLLGRPFALYDIWTGPDGQPAGMEIVYLEMGRATRQLPGCRPGEKIGIWGPLGFPFPEPATTAKKVFLVAGGIGQTPFLAHARELLGQVGYGGQPARHRGVEVHLVYGARSHDFHAGLDDFASSGASIHLATDDGSAGFHGRVTQCLEPLLSGLPGEIHLFGCGPEPMLEALSALAKRRNLLCHVSLETPMACGLGICFSCVTKVKTPEGWDYRRVCVDGPVFEASQLVWPQAHG